MIGIGASHPDKDWPDAAWCEFLRGLRTPGTVFLIGGPANLARAEKVCCRFGFETVRQCLRFAVDRRGGTVTARRSVRWSEFRAAEPCRRGRDRRLWPVRLDARAHLFEIHPRHRAGGWPLPWRHDANCAGAGAGTDRAFSVAAESVGIARAMSTVPPNLQAARGRFFPAPE